MVISGVGSTCDPHHGPDRRQQARQTPNTNCQWSPNIDLPPALVSPPPINGSLLQDPHASSRLIAEEHKSTRAQEHKS